MFINVVIFYPRLEIKKELARCPRNAYSLSPPEVQGLAPSWLLFIVFFKKFANLFFKRIVDVGTFSYVSEIRPSEEYEFIFKVSENAATVDVQFS